MGIWKSLFGKSEENNAIDKQYPEIPENFKELTQKAIDLIGSDSKNMDHEALYDYLISTGIPDFEAGELIIFLPIAFARKMLPELEWPPNYYDYYSKKKKIKRKYNENVRYRIIERETEHYWNATPNSEHVLNIVSRSADFQAINKLLNRGGKLKDVLLTESYVIR